MMKRLLALGLSCTLLLSLPVTASAARVESSAPKATASQSGPVMSTTGFLAYDSIAGKVRSDNLTVLALEETIASMEAMNWNKVIDDMEDAIDDLENTINPIKNNLSNVKDVDTQLKSLIAQLSASEEAVNGSTLANALTLMQLSSASASLATMESTLESLEDQLDDLKDQKKDYEKTVADTKRQIDSTIQQIITGAQSLYMTILSTELQMDALNDTQAATARAIQEMELRYERGQISRLTLTQVKNGYDTIQMNIGKLENAVKNMKASLQSLLGDSPTGRLDLISTPKVSENQLASLSYTADLAAAKEASYDLYSARRTVEDAEDDMNDARREEGKNSYQYKMAEHTYQAAVVQEESAIQNFELSFRSLYNALAPAQAAVETARNDCDYQEQVYAANQLKYQQGTISYNALLDAQDTLSSARRDLESAQMDLFTAWQSYQNAVQYGLVSSGS